MDHFWLGFLKQAASLIGSMPGITSGLRGYSRLGQIRTAKPVSGQVIGPRSIPPVVPGPKPIPGALATKGVHVAKPVSSKIPKPKTSRVRGMGEIPV